MSRLVRVKEFNWICVIYQLITLDDKLRKNRCDAQAVQEIWSFSGLKIFLKYCSSSKKYWIPFFAKFCSDPLQLCRRHSTDVNRFWWNAVSVKNSDKDDEEQQEKEVENSSIT